MSVNTQQHVSSSRDSRHAAPRRAARCILATTTKRHKYITDDAAGAAAAANSANFPEKINNSQRQYTSTRRTAIASCLAVDTPKMSHSRLTLSPERQFFPWCSRSWHDGELFRSTERQLTVAVTKVLDATNTNW